MALRPSFKLTAVGAIPNDWECTTIQGVASRAKNAIVGGPFGSDLVSRDYTIAGVPVIRGQNMGGTWVSGNFAFVSSDKAKSLEANLARPGDIVVTQRGTLGQVSVVPREPYAVYVVSQSQMKITVDPQKADPRFVYHVLTSGFHQDLIHREAIQTGVPHINLGILRSIPIQLPSLDEQLLIAQILNDIELLVLSVEHLLEKKRNVKTATAQDLLSGARRLPDFADFWTRAGFGSLARPRRERVNPRLAGAQENSVDLDQIESKSGRVIFLAETSDSSSLKTVYRKGDVLFGKLRAYLEKYWHADRDGVCSTEIWALQPQTDAVDSGFLFQLVRQPAFIRVASTAYGTHMPRSDWSVVKAFPVNLPPLDEQRAIAAVLSDMDAEIAALEAKRDKLRLIKEGMQQKLLTGKICLVPPAVAA